MFTIAIVLLFTLLMEALAAYLMFTGLAALQSSPNTPERLVALIGPLYGVVATLASVVVIASLWGIWRLRK